MFPCVEGRGEMVRKGHPESFNRGDNALFFKLSETERCTLIIPIWDIYIKYYPEKKVGKGRQLRVKPSNAP